MLRKEIFVKILEKPKCYLYVPSRPFCGFRDLFPTFGYVKHVVYHQRFVSGA